MLYPVFSMGTGRCGTSAIAHLMAHAGFYSFHEGNYVGGLRLEDRARHQKMSMGMFSAHDDEVARGYNAEKLLERVRMHNLVKDRYSLRLHEAVPQLRLAASFLHIVTPEAKVVHLYRNPVDTVLSFATKFPPLYANGHPPKHSEKLPVSGWGDTLPRFYGRNALECWAQYYDDYNRAIEQVNLPRWPFSMKDLMSLEKVNELLEWLDCPKVSKEALPVWGINGRAREQVVKGNNMRAAAEAAVERFVTWKP